MNIVLLFVPILMWSSVGIWVKVAAVSFAPPLISFLRFFLGLIFLGGFAALRGKPVRFTLSNRWVWAAAAAKGINYIAENQAITHGASWGYIVEQPVQAVAFLLVAALYFKERPSQRKVWASALCVAGATLIGMKGIAAARTGGSVDFLLFILAGLGASVHMTAQKVLVRDLDSASMNLSVFVAGCMVTALPLPVSGSLMNGPISTSALSAMLVLGFITGASFLLWGVALSRVPFLVSGITSNSLVLFALLWGVLFRGEMPDIWSLWGTLIFVAGLVAMNLPERKRAAQEAA